MGFSRQEFRSGWPSPSPRGDRRAGISRALQRGPCGAGSSLSMSVVLGLEPGGVKMLVDASPPVENVTAWRPASGSRQVSRRFQCHLLSFKEHKRFFSQATATQARMNSAFHLHLFVSIESKWMELEDAHLFLERQLCSEAPMRQILPWNVPLSRLHTTDAAALKVNVLLFFLKALLALCF